MALGLVPYLLPGVGLPPEKRSKFLQYLLQTSTEVPIVEVVQRQQRYSFFFFGPKATLAIKGAITYRNIVQGGKGDSGKAIRSLWQQLQSFLKTSIM